MIGRSCDNGRCGGGKAGPEHRFSRPAVDCDHWDEATTGKYVKAEDQGEAGEIIGAYVNTIGVPRGTIMGKSYGNDKWKGGF
jgi:hypothetical protein